MREPDLTGPSGWKAWKCRLPPVGKRGKPDYDAHVAAWVLHCPGAHAFWSWWAINLVHLRPIEGQGKPAHKNSPDMGWEIMCFAQDPAHQIDPDDPETARPLTPIDWIVQFGDVKADADAERVLYAAIKAIMTGGVSPDTDFARYWAAAIPATAKCQAEGGHPES